MMTMYYWHHFLPATRFWDKDTPDDELFSTSSVAFALGIGRKSVLQIPVKARLQNKGQRFYKKGDLVDWLERDAAVTGDGLLLKLRLAHKAEMEKRRPRRRAQVY